MKCILLVTCFFAFHVAIAEPAAPVPCSAPEYRQFDFWLGKCTAYSSDGKKQGTNHIHRVTDNCAIQENWNSGKFEGTSYNFYMSKKKTWHQTWIDNSGGRLLIEGGLVDGKMQLQGTRPSAEGEDIIDRITFSPLEDGHVRQHWQGSSDGKQWQGVFDGYYQRDESE